MVSWVMFGYRKLLRKENKNVKKNDFLIFDYPMENIVKKSNII